MSDSVQQLVDDFKAVGWKCAPFKRAVDLAIERPSDVAWLAMTIIDEFPGSSIFLDAVLAFMPLEDFPRVVEHALDMKSRNPDNKAADAVILSASLQAVSSLHPHLKRIFELRPNRDIYYENWPWRGSGVQNLDYLKGIVGDLTAPKETREKAWRALLETRNEAVFDYAIARFGSIDFEFDLPVSHYLDGVGFEAEERGYRQLYPNRVYHMLFPRSYFHEMYPSFGKHPSWQIQTPHSFTAKFGGLDSEHCAACNGRLDHILTLDPIPHGLEVTRINRLSLATCLTCLGWEQEILFYRHDIFGQATCVGYEGPVINPQFPAPPFTPVEIVISETPGRWQWQKWDQENLYRIGGYPTWVQNAEYPECPGCSSTMGFLLQIDSDIDGGWAWGTGGICYVFWCDQCKVSAFLWQCN